MATSGYNMDNALHKLIADDEVYKSFGERFLMQGKGRRPDVQIPPLNNKVLVQLWHLMLHSKMEQKKAVEWCRYLYQDMVQHNADDRLRHIMSKTYATAERMANDSPHDLTLFLDACHDFAFVSECLSTLKLDRNVLLSGNFNCEDSMVLTNELVLELEKFKMCERLPVNFTAKWICRLTSTSFEETNIKLLNARVDKLKASKRKIQLNKKLGENRMTDFFQEEFLITARNNENLSTKTVSSSNPPVKKKCSECDTLKCSLNISYELLKEVQLKVSSFEQQQLDLTNLKEENEKLKNELQTLRRKISRKDQKLCSTEIKLEGSNKKDQQIKNLEAAVDAKKKELKTIATEKKEVIKNNEKLQETIHKRQVLHEIQTKSGENNAYSDNMRQAVILLQCEAGVAAHNVSKVMRIIGKYIFEHEFDQLPSPQTCLHMLAEGLVLSDLQIGEKMLDSDSVTLHLDGTSRDHQKVVSHQITLDDGSNLYMGFTLVAQEDSKTLFDITLSLLKRISTLRSEISDQDQEQTFRSLIKSVMSDRAAVMKCFDRDLEKFLKSEFGEEFQLNFLHCNAHFLLGMSDVTDKAMRQVENEIRLSTNEQIGRDKDPQFSKFLGENESCCNRLIRLLCDILGPRGDQKSGCRVEWKEYCSDSKIPCFKSNRFNCFFEAAAAIIHHYDKIKSFLSSGVLLKPNQKVQSVCRDVGDLNLISCICALGIFYVKVSGPYWSLVNSSTSYPDFCHHIRNMNEKFLQWSLTDVSCETDLLSETSVDLFGSKFSLSSSIFHSSLHSFVKSPHCNRAILLQSLKSVSNACAVVTSRQHGNFLDGTFDPDDEALANVLKKCPLTNLIGESSFGDLDYDIRRRANCSYLQRSASHCLKRNKTCSEYLDSKPKSEKADLLKVARKKRVHYVQESKSNEIDVSIKIKEKMVEHQQKKIDLAATDLVKNGELTRRVEVDGVCKNSEDVDSLLESKVTKKQKLEAIKDQLRYYKFIMHVKDIKLSGSLEELVSKLKDFLVKTNPS